MVEDGLLEGRRGRGSGRSRARRAACAGPAGARRAPRPDDPAGTEQWPAGPTAAPSAVPRVTSAVASGTASSPASSSASTRASWTACRSSSSRDASLRPGDQCSSSPRAGPRHRLECLGVRGRGPPRLAGRGQRTTSPNQSLEHAGVHLVVEEVQAIAAGDRLDDVLAEAASQPDHAALHHFRPRRRQLVAPEGVREPLSGDGFTAVHSKSGEHHSVPRGERAAPVHLHRAKHPDRHARSVGGA